jgi:AcrR family transcriptional regulator
MPLEQAARTTESHAGAEQAGTYAKGRLRAADILDAAIDVLTENGYHQFSLRRVAETAGVRLGTLQHYYPSKHALMQAMLDRMIEGYLERLERILAREQDPEDCFRALVEWMMRDLNKRRTTVFFPELWSLANHEPQVTRLMEQMYARYRRVLEQAIARLNPALDAVQVRRLALFVSASIEGHTMFIGHGKPWKRETTQLLDMALQSFLWLIREGEVQGVRGNVAPAPARH